MHDPPPRMQSPPDGIRVVCRTSPSDAAANTSTEPSSGSSTDAMGGGGGGGGGYATANAIVFFVDYGDQEGFPTALSTGPAYDGASGGRPQALPTAWPQGVQFLSEPVVWPSQGSGVVVDTSLDPLSGELRCEARRAS